MSEIYYPFFQDITCPHEAAIILEKKLKDYKKSMRDDGEIKPDGRFKNVAAKAEFDRYADDLKDDWYNIFMNRIAA